MAERAILFIDGNNWYHACRGCGVKDLFALDYAAISRKLVSPRDWVGSRYYIGALKQEHKGYREQRQFLSRLQNTDARISVHLGRIEERPRINELSTELLAFLRGARLEPECEAELLKLAERYRWVSLLKEKAVDIMLAVEMYKLAVEDAYDAAYLLSGDGDFTPAVKAVRELGKKVYCASPMFSAALRYASNAFIPLKAEWFRECYSYSSLS